MFRLCSCIHKGWLTNKFLVLNQGKDDLNFEMINLVGADRRMRSWQLSENGEPPGFVQLTEQRVQGED